MDTIQSYDKLSFAINYQNGKKQGVLLDNPSSGNLGSLIGQIEATIKADDALIYTDDNGITSEFSHIGGAKRRRGVKTQYDLA